MSDRLGARQKKVLQFIVDYYAEKRYPPSIREISSGVGLRSSSTTHSHLRRLEEKGYIRRDPDRPRAIEVLFPPAEETSASSSASQSAALNVPIVGRVTAGAPILATENIESFMPIPRDFAPNEDVFVLRVQGESMINAGIYDNDFVLVERKNAAENGDIVVALLEDEATVKRFFKEADHIRLQPENETMAPIMAQEATILGKVIGLFRKLR